jgi:tape measure domain-containing protein
MTRNIGTFTAAGVDLDKSVSSIKGIANLAAVSGSTSQQASTAMYQLSQALAAGKVQLMDWNSVVNAGMGGQLFQDALKRTAKNMGKNVDGMIKKYGSFRESLTKGEWLTADVLTETLTQLSGAYTEADLLAKGYTKSQAKDILALADDAVQAATVVKTGTQLMDTLKETAQSGWTQTWEILIGDFEEAKNVWSSAFKALSPIIEGMSESRNKLLEGWAKGGGRDMALESIKNTFNGILSVVKPVKEAFREVFPAMTSKRLIEITKNIRDLTANFKLNEGQTKKLKATFKGFFSIIDIVWTVVKELASGALELFKSISGLGGTVLDTASSFGEWASNLRDTVKETDVFGKAVDKVVGFLTKIIDIIKLAIGKIKEFAGVLAENIHFPSMEDFFNFMTKVGDVFKKIGSVIGPIAVQIGEAFATAFRTGDIKAGLDVLNGGLMTGAIVNFNKLISGFFGAGTEAIEGLGGFGQIKDILGGVKDSLEEYQNSLKAETLKKIATAIAILAASIFVIALINPERLTASLGAITTLFAELMGSLAIFGKLGGTLTGVGKAVGAMIGLSIAIAILAVALAAVSAIDEDKIGTGLMGILGLAGIVVGAVKLMSTDTGKVMSGALGLIFFAAAIKILASACATLSELNFGELVKGLIGVGALMFGVSKFLNNTKMQGKMVGTALGMILLGAAMKIMASVAKDFSTMNLEQLAKGLGGVGLLLGEIAGFTHLVGGAKNLISTGIAMAIMGGSMKIFASAMKDFAGMKWDEIGRGLTAMGGALAEVIATMHLMPKNSLGTAVSLVIVAAALSSLAKTFGSMGNMNWDEIGRGLTALGGSLAILAAALYLMKGSIAGAAAMIIAAGALAIITPVLKTLGSMSLEQIGKGLLAIAGVFVILGVAGLALGGMIGPILAVSGAIALLGLGCLMAGVGISAFAVGLTTLATGVAGGATAIAAAVVTIVTAVLSLIPVLASKLGEAIIVLAQVLAQGAPALGSAVVAIIGTILNMLNQLVPQFIEVVMNLLSSLLRSIDDHLPEILESGINIILTLLRGIRDNIGEILVVAGEIIGEFIIGIGNMIGELVDAGFQLIVNFINGLSDAIDKNTDLLISAVQRLMLSVIRAAVKVLTFGIVDIKDVGKKIMESGLVKGIKSTFSKITNTVKEIPKKAVNAIKNKVSDFKSVGKDVIDGFVNGIKSGFNKVVTAGSDLGKKALQAAKNALKSKSPSKKFIQLGKDSDRGLIIGFKALSGKVANAAKGVATSALDSARKTISNISDIIGSDVDNQPIIRPVVDLSAVSAGASAIDGMFGMTPSVGVLSDLRSIGSMMNGNQNGGNDDVVSAINKLGKTLGNLSGDTYNVNGITYDDGSNITNAVHDIVRAAKIQRRV